uniref:Uncharacterized protein n=1 Tax=Anguilla anguilla TaxID=7936 RepID=A0A0E9WYI4_ANGAN
MLSTYSSQIQSVYEKCRYRESFMFTLYVNTLKMGNPEIALLEKNGNIKLHAVLLFGFVHSAVSTSRWKGLYTAAPPPA